MLWPRRRKLLGPCLRGEKELLHVRSGHSFQPSPLVDGKENCGFHPALGDDLWPFGEGGIEELAESRLSILNRPFLAPNDLMSIVLTSYQTRRNGRQSQ